MTMTPSSTCFSLPSKPTLSSVSATVFLLAGIGFLFSRILIFSTPTMLGPPSADCTDSFSDWILVLEGLRSGSVSVRAGLRLDFSVIVIVGTAIVDPGGGLEGAHGGRG